MVPCLYSPAPTTAPSTSMSSPLRLAVLRSERAASSSERSASSSESERTTMRRISPKVEPASAQNVRVVRSFRTSAADLGDHRPASVPPVSSRNTASSDWRGR